MRKPTPIALSCIIASVVGGLLTLIAFTSDVEKTSVALSNGLNCAILPGTFATSYFPAVKQEVHRSQKPLLHSPLVW